jgi:general L-amino acid transport system substrate-binding protein
MRHPILILASVAGIIILANATHARSSTLDEVKKRGDLRCGVNIGLAGFSAPDDKGEWTGLDVDFCRAKGQVRTAFSQRTVYGIAVW